MAKLEDRLVAGLEAQGYIETRTVSGAWRRFGKFGRGAMYVMLEGDGSWGEGQAAKGLHFSELHIPEPQVPVYGPILEQVLLAGDKWLAETRPDTEALLIELMCSDDSIKRDGGNDEDDEG